MYGPLGKGRHEPELSALLFLLVGIEIFAILRYQANLVSMREAFAISALCCLAGCKTLSEPTPKTAAAVESDPTLRFGIAMQSSGHVCLSVSMSTLSAGTPVTLVVAERPQSTADAVVIGAATNCPAMSDAHSASYELRISRGHIEDNVECIAVIRPATFSAGVGDIVIGRLDSGGTTITFRSCESSEGVHLTVWSGAALQGVRLWHGYHHLDYGVEPNCTAKETEP